MAGKREKVIQTRIGERVVELDKVLHFPRGLIGMEKHRDFVLLQIREGSPFLVLQCMTNPRVGLLVADPFSFIDGYEVHIGEPEQRILRLKNKRQAAVLVTVSIPPGEPDKTALNLSGPILVNHDSRIGLQAPQVDTRYPTHHYLHQGKTVPGQETEPSENADDSDTKE